MNIGSSTAIIRQSAGSKMIEPAFCSVWNWDARPFPVFPARSDVWGDAGNWPSGNWLSGKGPFVTPATPDPAPTLGTYPAFPELSGRGWSVRYKPQFTTASAEHVSGRASRFARMSAPLYEIEITFDVLRMDAPYTELGILVGFIAGRFGQDLPFTFPVPAELGVGAALTCRFVDDAEDLEEFMNRLWRTQSLNLRSVKGE